MAETLTFHFEGALEDGHEMNFYESARFQYAAARLMVKLAQYRKRGKFVKNISDRSNIDIRLLTQTDGSFNINIEDADEPEDVFVDVSLSDLISYISERLIEKLEDENVVATLNQANDSSVLDDAELEQAIESYLDGNGLTASLNTEARNLVKRRIAEVEREQVMIENEATIAKINEQSGRGLVAMAAPLLSEMAQTALRRSANTFEVIASSGGQSRPVLFLDRKMAKEIEFAIVDEQITPILGNVIQFNKANGWGKVEIEAGAKTLSFSIPYDKLGAMKQTLIDQMKKDLVYLQAYFVRDQASEVKRLIVVGILPTPTS